VAFAEAHQERVKAQDHRDKLEEQRLDDKQAAAEQQLNEVLAEQAKTKAAKEAKNEALKAEQLKMEQLKASMTAEFKASEARQRSAIKSVSNDNCKIITTAIAETFHKGEEELNATFDSGVDAGIAHEAQAEKARKEAAMAKVTLHARATRPSPLDAFACSVWFLTCHTRATTCPNVPRSALASPRFLPWRQRSRTPRLQTPRPLLPPQRPPRPPPRRPSRAARRASPPTPTPTERSDITASQVPLPEEGLQHTIRRISKGEESVTA
jgi:hypothetical protein